ncbi:hypothetical protein [Nocardia sp. alder85J]|uniref:hypothetical protein n=1 Tax=Nocardia sp. alder85J TaxID=2862949 RepID=UPI001CD32019|nr:hypothetical protein [Nocardia sp. alder85J]MCX4096127.1 hypothetical protein [Nocardia sp. alder85J]
MSENSAAAICRVRPAIRLSVFRALRSRPFRWYFAGQIVSASGTFVQSTAVGRLVLRVTGSPASRGLVLAAAASRTCCSALGRRGGSG